MCSAKRPAAGSIRVTPVAGEHPAARPRHARVQCVQQAQRVAVAVERAPRAADDVRPDARQAARHRGAVEDLDRILLEARLREQPRHPFGAPVEFARRQAHVQAARLPQRDVDAGFLAQQRGQPRPFARGRLRPSAVGRHAEALALHPDEAEVAARGAMRDVAFVEQRETRAQRAHAEGDRGAD